MPRTTPEQDARAYALRTSESLSISQVALRLGCTPQQAAHAITRHARIHSLPDPVRRRSLRAASRYANGAGLPFDASQFAEGAANAIASEMGGAFVTGRTFGIEIEFRRPSRRRTYGGIDYTLSPSEIVAALNAAGLHAEHESYNHHTRPHWKLIHDASSDQELVSPVLSGRDGLREVRTAMQVLRSLGCKVTTTEGMHVHVYAGDFAPARVADTFAFYAHRQQSVYSRLVSAARRSAYYCAEVDDHDAERTRRLCARGNVTPAVGRYVSVNLESYARYQTIEFRQHQGSLNGRKACDWIELLLATVTAIEQSVEANCPDDLHGTLDYLVAARLLKSATRDRLVRKATSYGFPPPSDPQPTPAVRADVSPEPTASDETVRVHNVNGPNSIVNFAYENCTCVACVRALDIWASGNADLRVVFTNGSMGRTIESTQLLNSAETTAMHSASMQRLNRSDDRYGVNV